MNTTTEEVEKHARQVVTDDTSALHVFEVDPRDGDDLNDLFDEVEEALNGDVFRNVFVLIKRPPIPGGLDHLALDQQVKQGKKPKPKPKPPAEPPRPKPYPY